MLLQYLLFVVAAILTVEQAFDVISTNLVISKGRGQEGNGIVAWLMSRMGRWWPAIKLPLVAIIWYSVIFMGHVVALLVGYTILVAIYGYVLWNNYKIAWRK